MWYSARCHRDKQAISLFMLRYFKTEAALISIRKYMIIEVIPLEVQMRDGGHSSRYFFRYDGQIVWPLQQLLLEGLHKILNLPDFLWDCIARASRPSEYRSVLTGPTLCKTWSCVLNIDFIFLSRLIMVDFFIYLIAWKWFGSTFHNI